LRGVVEPSGNLLVNPVLHTAGPARALGAAVCVGRPRSQRAPSRGACHSSSVSKPKAYATSGSKRTTRESTLFAGTASWGTDSWAPKVHSSPSRGMPAAGA